MKEMPERIYLFDCNESMTVPLEGDTEYIRKDILDDMIKTAEDHRDEYIDWLKSLKERKGGKI